MAAITWTNPSVTRIVDSGHGDPFDWVEARARNMALDAMEKGWTGPPYDPFQLADHLDIETVARQDLQAREKSGRL